MNDEIKCLLQKVKKGLTLIFNQNAAKLTLIFNQKCIELTLNYNQKQ